jgi:hypothetical protein
MSENREMIERPSFLPAVDSDAVQKDNALMNQYCKPPRIKIIQKMSSAPFKPPFTDKDVIVTPQMIKIADEANPFSFTPLFYFPDWACWNPYKMKATLPAIRESSFDPTSSIAIKARKFVKEPCPENPEFQIRYCQHHNFYCAIHGIDELTDIPVLFSFIRGEYKTGDNLIGQIQTRQAPKFACRFLAVPADHEGSGEDWYGTDIIDDDVRWVTEHQYAKYEKLAAQLQVLYDSNQVIIDRDDTDVVVASPTVDSEF